MLLRTIVVHVDSSEATSERLAAVVELAAEHGAYLVGVHPQDPGLLPIYLERSDALVKAQEQWAKEETARSRKLFQEAVSLTSLSAEWREPAGWTAEMTARHGQCGDLLVVGQQDPDALAWSTPATLVEDLIFASGRPILVLPLSRAKTLFRHILVAWNASREAARAINDALPILTRAQLVTVLAIHPEADTDEHGEVSCADICLHLARHGISAEGALVSADGAGTGDVLLSEARARGSDLIVMGAYGRSRLRERILGGATRAVLRSMTVPVLLSH